MWRARLRELPGAAVVALAALYFIGVGAPALFAVPIVVMLGELLRPC